uniref:Uncharacterized protein n=2 Tax=Plectus sambesii TaxID=2011161 RepID=A0A914W6Z8_9BILA
MLIATRHSLLSARVRTAPCCSCSSKAGDKKGREVKYPPITPPYYRKARPASQGFNILQKEFPNVGDRTGDGPRLHDYKVMGEMAAALPTVTEKVDFVSPYERPWKKFERTWHRTFHPSLVVPRKAWAVEPVTRGYDTLHFYEFITKTKTQKGVDAWHKDLHPPTTLFEKKLKETLLCKLRSQSTATSADRVAFSNVFLQHLLEDALHSVTSDHLQKARVSYAPRCESFWVRGGFKDVCGYDSRFTDEDREKYGRSRPRRFTGDDRRRLGELAFVCRDSFAAQIRSTNPLRPLIKINDEPDSSLTRRNAALTTKESAEENDATEDKLSDEVDEKRSDLATYSPKAMGMWPDEEPLWMAPGYEMDSGEQHRFGLVGLRDASAIEERCSYWGVADDEADADVKNEMYIAMAVSSLFSWLNGQAHALGFTQYNDLTYPLVSQLILSDGKKFFFAVGQLNTLAININAGGFVNNRWNRCWFDGPYDLYDSMDEEGRFWQKDGETEGLNQEVLSRILKMLLLVPTPDRELVDRDLTPFIPKRVEQDDRDSDVFNVFKGKA